MKEKVIYKRNFKEAADVSGIIGEVIDTDWSGSNKEQMKAVQLLKGIATSDDPKSNKFMKALDKATSSMSKDDFKESVLKERLEEAKEDDAIKSLKSIIKMMGYLSKLDKAGINDVIADLEKVVNILK